ncbi:hypothetical protein J1TS1_17290 [Shouchella clausii]|uniref:hypothetical protein n=1 Tax=Shouchella TaxID=2893057 RepID=UPI001B24A0F8|nr:hypothetical protein [Shouchella clausii]MDO7285098.1 hypothetical protein [Shouchella clausii]MDO7305034.1 hypothetical protein [Shouchella clausii]GIN07584.1 hypothetical protein J1TS1_17290 [Shouchella clausii]
MSILHKSYRDRLRILLVIYFFSQNINEDEKEKPYYQKEFKSEVRIQKIDFLIRYPDYLAYELLDLLQYPEFEENKEDVKANVKEIFGNNEPDIRREDMLRFFYGAYEDIDHIIAFLVSIGFIEYTSKRNLAGRVFEKVYYLTEYGVNKIEREILNGLEKAKWYESRCHLIKKYFGDLSGTELKVRQYEHEEYRTTALNQYIKGIQENVKRKYQGIFGEEI